MSVRQGYKQTDIGEIPEEWDVARLATVSDIVGGSTPSTSEPTYWNGDIPFVTPSDVTALNGKNMLSTTEKYITKKGLQSISAKLLAKGSILLTSRATIGVCAINDVEVVTNQGFANFVPKEGIDGLWLLYQLRLQRRELERLASGSTFKEVSKSSLRRMKVPLPPAPEQQKIASILSTVDETIQRTNEVIGKTEVLKRGMMQRLLTRGIGHTRFKQTELGEIPETWKTTPVGKICELKGGKRLPKGHSFVAEKTPYPYVRVVDFERGSVTTIDLKYISEETHNQISRYIISSDDVFISIAGTIGLAGVVPEELSGSNLTENAAKLCKLESITPLFLSYVLNSDIGQQQIKKFVGITSQPKLALFRIKKIIVPLPPISEQNEITSMLSALDEKILLERRNKEKLEGLKKGLMQVLLTGRVRVKVA